ncbi:hypothetical protein [Pseudohalioglobus lutimaris]|uniref:Uncharacterized protein n=1 Tax=Pseudohalioglobus lutimaris TaxID=1737061 RepID=A0A2N5X881_9GAMM|nr:hypothetical protein [Pseudohalioglobus lutimaris]PLW70694.1 hypothetical protein C0039_00750 [Pseudohalioglobus lutimaris]
MAEETQGEKASVKQRLQLEMREYLIISAYLWVCFSTILIYESALLSDKNIAALPLSAAVVKALIFGKFILIGKALKPGTRMTPNVLLLKIFWKALGLLAMLVIFTGIEELIVGMVHGQAVAETLAELAARPLLQFIAPSLLMLLVLVPMIAFEEVDRELGQGTLRRILFSSSGSG